MNRTPSFRSGLLLWACFILYSLVHAPIPGVNESHYLTKARHYWQPDWLAGDLFLESSNPHQFFYQTFGLLTLILSFPMAALIGRLIALGVLAWGWQRLGRTITGSHIGPTIAAAVFLLFAAIGNFSGEWLVGGVESKVVSYAFVFAGLASFLQRRFPFAGVYLGLGVAFHPLVGLWAVIAIAIAVVAKTVSDVVVQQKLSGSTSDLDIPGSAFGTALLISVSAVGVVPALQAIGGATPSEAYQSNYLQVYFRLSHHLDPMEFSLRSYATYFILTALILLICSRSKQRELHWIGWFTLAAAVIAVSGVLIGARLGEPADMPFFKFRLSLLKYYPFRLFDLVVPVMLSMLVGRHCARNLWQLHPRTLSLSAFVILAMSLFLTSGQGSITRLTSQWERDWIDVCHWSRENTPENAVFYTPREAWSFKWFAERREWIAFKDCPQDAKGIIEWNRRLNWFSRWASENYGDERYSAEELRKLRVETGVTHIIARSLGPFDAPVVYRNRTYRVHELPAE